MDRLIERLMALGYEPDHAKAMYGRYKDEDALGDLETMWTLKRLYDAVRRFECYV